MCDWTRWTQKYYEPLSEKDCSNRWYRTSFLMQMVEIEGELSHVFCDKGRLERIRSEPDYLGEPQTIQRLFEITKSDPKNAALLREIQRAEEEVYAYLTSAPGAPPEKELRAYWQAYFDSFLAELDSKDKQKFYILSKGGEQPRIYADVYSLMGCTRICWRKAPPAAGQNRIFGSTPMTSRMVIGTTTSSRKASCRRWCGNCYGNRRGWQLITPERAERREKFIRLHARADLGVEPGKPCWCWYD